ncbi:hypothetical protein vseg_010648 [Gypsophila vaccaria]
MTTFSGTATTDTASNITITYIQHHHSTDFRLAQHRPQPATTMKPPPLQRPSTISKRRPCLDRQTLITPVKFVLLPPFFVPLPALTDGRRSHLLLPPFFLLSFPPLFLLGFALCLALSLPPIFIVLVHTVDKRRV